MTGHRIYVDGRVHIRRHMCSSCIFGPRSPVGATRVEQMIVDAGDWGCIPCHHHLGGDLEPVCAGFDRHHSSVAVRLAHALDVVTWVEGDPWHDADHPPR